MPLHGKIVVIKRSGGDGTEFPLTASCLFGRKPDCDIRIQVAQVSKEHCRIDLNENKEVILTNLSSVNPTRVNGEALQQSERLKHGDVITIVDRSFRFEYPPAPTPKKFAKEGKSESPKPHLKDGTNHSIQRSLEDTKEAGDMEPSKAVSPFSDLYQMIRKSLDVKTPRKYSDNNFQRPMRKIQEDAATIEPPKTDLACGEGVAEAITPKSNQKIKNPSQILVSDAAHTPLKDAENVISEATSPQTRQRMAPQRFSAGDAMEKVCSPTPKSPMRRRSKEVTPAKEQGKVMHSPKADSAGVAGKVLKKRKSAELLMKKRVSFGGYLVPELFDKKLPPDSPLRKGDTPRRSLSLEKPKQSLLRRASVIGLLNEADVMESPNRPPAKKSLKRKSLSPGKTKSVSLNRKSPGKKSPKSASPKRESPGKKSPKSASPKRASPGKKSPKSASPKRASPGKKSPKSASPKRESPGKKSPKSASPKRESFGKKSPKAASLKRESPGKKSPKSKTPSPKLPRSTRVSPKGASPRKKSPKSSTLSAIASPSGKKSPTSKPSTPKRAFSFSKKLATPMANTRTSLKSTPSQETPKAKTSSASQRETSSVQGRFSVSRIKTPSPIAEDAVTTQCAMDTPKIPLRRKSMKSTSRKTPCLARSAVKVMLRRSSVSRASLKVMSTWADTVKFGKAKVKAVVPAKKVLKSTSNATTVKKNMSKQKTPVRKPLGHTSTGHANSPVTIIVGRALKQTAVHAAAVPKVVFSTAISKKNLKMDEDLSGISEMFKTPVNERKQSSLQNKSSAVKAPVGVMESALPEPSLLNTPEEPGEMMVSPLTAASVVKAGRFNKEAVKRLLDDESSFNCDVSTLDSVATPEQKPQLPECLTGGKRTTNTLTQEPVQALREKLVQTPKQKPEQQELVPGVKKITPKPKNEPVEDLRGKLLKTPKQKPEQQECLTGVKRIMKTPRQKTTPIEHLRGKLLKTPKQKPQVADISFGGLADLLKTPQGQESQSQEADTETPNVEITPMSCMSDVKRMVKTPKQKSAPVEDMFGIERLMKTPKERSEPVEEHFGIKRLVKSPRLRGNAPVEDFEGLQDLMEEPIPEPLKQTETSECGDQATLNSSDLVIAAKELDFTLGQAQNEDGSSKLDISKGETATVLVEVPIDYCEPSDAKEVFSEAVIEDETPAMTEIPATDAAPSKKPIRGRKAKMVKSKAANNKQEMAEPSQDIVPVRGRRGRNADPVGPTRDVVEPAQEEAKAAQTTKKGRGAKKVSEQVETFPESKQSLPPADNGRDAPLEKDAVKPKQGRKPKHESVQSKTTLPETDLTSAGSDHASPEGDGDDKLEQTPSEQKYVLTVQKKSVRGRRGKLVVDSRAEEEVCKEAVDLAVVKARRGKKTVAIATPARRQTTRSKKPKEDSVGAQSKIVQDVEVNLEPVMSADAVNEETTSTTMQEDEPAVELVVKPSRGRKTKRAQLEPPQPVPEGTPNSVSKQAKLPASPSPKRRRGRKVISVSAELKEVSKDPSEETKQQSKSVSKTRGRNTRQVAEPQEAVKKLRNSKKDVEEHVPVETEAPLVTEPQKVCDTTPGVAKTRRGGVKKSKQEAAKLNSESTEDQEGPIETPTEKPKRDRGSEPVEDVDGTTEVSEEKPEQKPQRGRGVKTNSKRDLLQVVPAKRARRGAKEVEVPESTAALVKPVKRGRQAAAKVSSESNTTHDSNAKISTRSVRWKPEVEVYEIPKATPVKVVRGRKSKLADQADTPSQSESKNAHQTEEDLSGKAAEAQPAKRTRQGAKAAGKAESPNKVEEPRTRRGRSANK
ncbi:proliferation marker protein Ki-67 isoform X2 [Entelurus aequoreus]|uniref:proliferation marker protein Ki-67 isoform X2 n=1 Tax=Entelurus aequoreus TaxID=161455 RepID=UPI002B1D829B|nr:proliferation marker protein Ki-67 isoform X2 [Entelurus aequoreus]